MNTTPALPELAPVESSVIAFVGYDAALRTLCVQMSGAGHMYLYRYVPPDIWDRFNESESKGAFFSKWIRPVFTAEKLTGECDGCGDVGRLGEICTDCGTARYAAREHR